MFFLSILTCWLQIWHFQNEKKWLLWFLDSLKRSQRTNHATSAPTNTIWRILLSAHQCIFSAPTHFQRTNSTMNSSYLYLSLKCFQRTSVLPAAPVFFHRHQCFKFPRTNTLSAHQHIFSAPTYIAMNSSSPQRLAELPGNRLDPGGSSKFRGSKAVFRIIYKIL